MVKKPKSAAPRAARPTKTGLQASIRDDIKRFELAARCKVKTVSYLSADGKVKIDTVPLPE